MTNYFASSLLDAMGKVLHLHTGTCQYSDFRDLFLRFLAFRLAFFGAVAEHQTKHEGSTFSFTAPNQMKPSEIRECQFGKGSLSIKYQGTPLW